MAFLALLPSPPARGYFFCIARVAKVSQWTQSFLHSLRSLRFMAFLALLSSVSACGYFFCIAKAAKVTQWTQSFLYSLRSLRFMAFLALLSSVSACGYFLYRKGREGYAMDAKFSVFPALLAVHGVPCVTSFTFRRVDIFFVSQRPRRLRNGRKVFCIPCAPCGSWRSLRYFPRSYFLYRKAREGFAMNAKSPVFLAPPDQIEPIQIAIISFANSLPKPNR